MSPSIIVPYVSHSRSPRDETSVDFFCKTEEQKTEKEVQYCKDFYIKKACQEAFMVYLILWIICAAILFMAFMDKALDWKYGGWKLAGITFGGAFLICMIVRAIVNF